MENLLWFHNFLEIFYFSEGMVIMDPDWRFHVFFNQSLIKSTTPLWVMDIKIDCEPLDSICHSNVRENKDIGRRKSCRGADIE
jgi:hypothetical protein